MNKRGVLIRFGGLEKNRKINNGGGEIYLTPESRLSPSCVHGFFDVLPNIHQHHIRGRPLEVTSFLSVNSRYNIA